MRQAAVSDGWKRLRDDCPVRREAGESLGSSGVARRLSMSIICRSNSSLCPVRRLSSSRQRPPELPGLLEQQAHLPYGNLACWANICAVHQQRHEHRLRHLYGKGLETSIYCTSAGTLLAAHLVQPLREEGQQVGGGYEGGEASKAASEAGGRIHQHQALQQVRR